MSFADELAEWGLTTEQQVKDAFAFATEAVTQSVLDGSALTGAPGQPIITKDLYNSWIPEFTNGEKTEFEIATSNPYAESIEDGANDRAFFDTSRENGSLTNRRERSPVGGYHSVKLTEASWDKIVEFAAQKAFGQAVFH